jgi:hypothetical protein
MSCRQLKCSSAPLGKLQRTFSLELTDLLRVMSLFIPSSLLTYAELLLSLTSPSIVVELSSSMWILNILEAMP